MIGCVSPRWAVIVFLAMTLPACDEPPREAAEIGHCRAILGWMTKGLGEAKVLDSRSWDGGSGRNVTLSYELVRPQTGPNAPSHSFIQCRYASAAKGKAHRIWAESVVMGGTPLSDKQVQTVNVTISLIGERKGKGDAD